MLYCRILPEITPITGVADCSILTRNVALGNISITSPSTLIPSSLAKCECYPFYSIPTETAPGILVAVPDSAYFRVGLFLRGFIYRWRQFGFVQGTGHAAELAVDLFEIHGDCFSLQGTGHPVTEYLSLLFIGMEIVISRTICQDVFYTLFIEHNLVPFLWLSQILGLWSSRLASVC